MIAAAQTSTNARRAITRRSPAKYRSRTASMARSRCRLNRSRAPGRWSGGAGPWGDSPPRIARDIIGTSVRERKYEASIEKTTAPARGVNRYLAAPVRRSTGKNTMQIDSVETIAGTAIWAALSSTATVSGLPSARLRWMFSTSTVASSTSMPIASAKPPSVMMLTELSVRNSATIPTRIESGIEMATTSVLRQLPRNTRTISETRRVAMTASRTTLAIAARTNTDWSKPTFSWSPGGACAMTPGSRPRTASTTVVVDASECLRMARNVERWPFTRTMLVWGAKPKWTLPTSPTSTGAPFTTLIGSLLNSSVVSGLEFSRMSYSVSPIFAVPAGRIRFELRRAVTTSFGETL